jgi:hypothetical protein
MPIALREEQDADDSDDEDDMDSLPILVVGDNPSHPQTKELHGDDTLVKQPVVPQVNLDVGQHAGQSDTGAVGLYADPHHSDDEDSLSHHTHSDVEEVDQEIDLPQNDDTDTVLQETGTATEADQNGDDHLDTAQPAADTDPDDSQSDNGDTDSTAADAQEAATVETRATVHEVPKPPSPTLRRSNRVRKKPTWMTQDHWHMLHVICRNESTT